MVPFLRAGQAIHQTVDQCLTARYAELTGHAMSPMGADPEAST